MPHNLFRNNDGSRYCSRCDRQWDADEVVGEPCVAIQGEIFVDDDAAALMPKADSKQWDAEQITAITSKNEAPITLSRLDPIVTGGYVQVPTELSAIKSPHSQGVFRKPRLIAFAGKKGSGKDTAAQVLIENGFTRVAMAGALKDMLRALMAYRGYDSRLIERHIEGDMKEVPCAAFNGRSFRYAAQHLGTEYGREMIDPKLWVDAVKDRTAYLLNRGESVVITDIRFPNEGEMVRSMGGTVCLVERPGLTATDNHVSENQLDGVQWEHVFENSGTIEDLRRLVSFTFSI